MFGKTKKVVENKKEEVKSQPLSLNVGNELFIQVKLLEAVNKNIMQMVQQLAEIKNLLAEKNNGR